MTTLIDQIVHVSWGHGMTINTFAKVVHETPTRVKLQPLRNEVVESKDGFTGFEIAGTIDDRKPVLLALKDGDAFRSGRGSSTLRFRAWDGKPTVFDHLD